MTPETKQAHYDKLNAQLREWTAKVEVVKARIAQGSANVRIEYHTQIEAWTTKESAIRKKLEDLRIASAEKYDSVKTTIQEAWTELSQLTNSISKEEKTNEKQ